MKHRNRGNVLVMALVLVAAIVGAWQYSEYRSNQRKLQEAAAQAQRQREAEEQQRKVEEALRQAELKAMQEREAEAKKQKDALVQALKAVDDFVVRWEDAARVAGVTSRIALSGQVTAMQTLKREAATLVVPPCLDAGKTSLDKSINVTIEAYMIFIVEKGDLGKELTSSLLKVAHENMDAFKKARASCPS